MSATTHCTLPRYVRKFLQARGANRRLKPLCQPATAIAASAMRGHGASAPATASGLALVATAVEEVDRKQQTLDLSSASAVRDAFQTARPLFVAVSLLADRLGWTAADLVADVARFHRCYRLARAFVLAIRPRTLDGLARDMDFEARLCAWAERSGWAVSVLKQHASSIFAAALGATCPEGPERLCALIPPDRLATFADAQLQYIAANYAKWHGLVEYLREPAARRRLDPREAPLNAEVKKLARVIAAKRGPRFAEDAAQAAIVDAIKPDSLRGYDYDCEFFDWLVAKALNSLACEARASRKAQSLEATPKDPERTPPERAADKEECGQAFAERLCRLAFARTLFIEQHERLTQMWMLGLLFDEALSDSVLAAVFEMSDGHDAAPSGIQVARHRLRQRLYAIDQVLISDSPAFNPIIDAVKDDCGWDERDDYPVRRAIAYALAARADGDRLMLWPAVLNTALGSKDVNRWDNAGKLARDLQRLWLASGGIGASPYCVHQIDGRLGRLRQWLDSNPLVLRKLKAIASGAKARYLIGPCLYLSVVQTKPMDDCVKAMPLEDATEREAFRSMLENIVPSLPGTDGAK